jgi:hypothetical protein
MSDGPELFLSKSNVHYFGRGHLWKSFSNVDTKLIQLQAPSILTHTKYMCTVNWLPTVGIPTLK